METKTSRRPFGRRCFLAAGGLLLGIALAASCQLPKPPPAEPTEPAASSQLSAPEQLVIRQSWQSGRHADTFVTGDGANNDCARCHSPRNWVPASAADMPSTCASCKFTVPVPKPVAKQEWRSIDCDICHRLDKGVVSGEVVWLNALVAQYDNTREPYEAVKSTNELCEKCHTDTTVMRARVDLGRNAHVGYACTKCHDPHSGEASCTKSCHAEVLKPVKATAGHDAAHANVACVACHDASGAKVGPLDGQSTWGTFRTVEAKGKTSTAPYVSHNVQRQVDCARCHFADNPWRLKTVR